MVYQIQMLPWWIIARFSASQDERCRDGAAIERKIETSFMVMALSSLHPSWQWDLWDETCIYENVLRQTLLFNSSPILHNTLALLLSIQFAFTLVPEVFSLSKPPKVRASVIRPLVLVRAPSVLKPPRARKPRGPRVVRVRCGIKVNRYGRRISHLARVNFNIGLLTMPW